MTPQTPTRCIDYANATTPAERLSTALKMARTTIIVWSDDDKGQAEEATEERLRVGDIDQRVASTRDLTLEMESAGLEMQRALQEAQDFLALEDRQDTIHVMEEQRQDMECDEREVTPASNLEDPLERIDVQSLLDEIAALKKEIKETNDEVMELKSALNSSINNAASTVAKSPVDEVLCSKSTCDTTFITCSIRNGDEEQCIHGENEMISDAEFRREDRETLCSNSCFLGIFANLIAANIAFKKQSLLVA